MFSNVTYESLSGTNTPRDFVEFPSQLMENWMRTPEVLGMFARHYKTGEPIPAELVAKLEKASTFNQGFATTEYLASAIMDMRFHTTDPEGLDPDKFERETLGVASRHLHDALERGAILEARPPAGDFVLEHGERLESLGDNLDLNGAAFHAHLGLCRFLLEKGADPNALAYNATAN